MMKAVHSPRTFPTKSMRREGDDSGRLISHVLAGCAECGAKDYVPATTYSGMLGVEQGERLFRRRGWWLGPTRNRDRCPMCAGSARKSRGASTLGDLAPELAALATPAPEPLIEAVEPLENPMPSTPPPVAEPTRTQKRSILDQLEDVYMEAKGYKGDWSDAKVAEKLDVPRIWVSNIRADFFGEDVNEQAKQIAADLAALDVRCRAFEAKIEKALGDLSDEASKIKTEVLRLRGVATLPGRTKAA